MPPKRIYWVGGSKFADGYVHERPVHALLREAGIEVVLHVWNRDPMPTLGPGEHLIIRTPWDYVENFAKFEKWMSELPKSQVHNPAAILRWNADKSYLRELEWGGVRIVPTIWLNSNSEEEIIQTVREAFPNRRKIVKPVRSHSSIDTFRLGVDEGPPLGVFMGRPAMIQAYLSEIENDGERSLIFFDGKFSHAIRKRPQLGDFRVQESHGGLFSAIDVSPEELRFGDQVISAVRTRFPKDSMPLYGRIDYVLVDGRPHLMEAELLEPDLYFHHAPGAAERFARVLIDVLN